MRKWCYLHSSCFELSDASHRHLNVGPVFGLIWHRKRMRGGMRSDGSMTCVSCGRCSPAARSVAETGSGPAMTSGTAGRSATESATSGDFLPLML